MGIENIKYDAVSGDYEALVSIDNRQYRMTLLDFIEEQRDEATRVATDVCSWVASAQTRMKDFCASKLLDLKNNSWLGEEERPLTKEAFMETIELKAITAFSDGSFELYFDDGDLFWGHTILVSVDKAYELMEAEIAG